MGRALTDVPRRLWPDAMGWTETLVCADGDDRETRQRKRLFAASTVLVVPAGLAWGGIYFAFGERWAAAVPTAYAVLTFADLALLVRIRRYTLYRQAQQSFIIVLPFVLQVALGGFVGSSGVIIWSFIAVLMGLLFGGRREAAGWFVAYLAGIAAATAIRPDLDLRNGLPDALVLVLFALNIGTVSLIASLVLSSFVEDRRRLRELEVAYLDQELALRQSEKMATLGTLAAGVAHELNNPAAATQRAAGQLRDAVGARERAMRDGGAPQLTPAGERLARELEHRARDGGWAVTLGPLERSDRELAMEAWLAERDVPEAAELAPALVEQGLEVATLSELAGGVESQTLAAVLGRAATGSPIDELIDEISDGAGRISEIVAALRNYSYLDQAPVQDVDVREGLDSTLVLLAGKLSDGIRVRREYADDLPPFPAHGGELNQVWTSLLDNAADAMGARGEIAIRTRREGDWAVVEVEDDGPGIPEAFLTRIFDPFFTTKDPGRGTGLGLSTAFAIVTGKHGGRISVASRPGSTCFTVRLPLGP